MQPPTQHMKTKVNRFHLVGTIIYYFGLIVGFLAAQSLTTFTALLLGAVVVVNVINIRQFVSAIYYNAVNNTLDWVMYELDNQPAPTEYYD